MTATAIAADDPDEWRKRWDTGTASTGYTVQSVAHHGYHSYAELMEINNRIRAVLKELQSGAYGSKSRDFGRGVAFAANYIQAALEAK